MGKPTGNLGEIDMAEWIDTFKGAVLAAEYDFTSHMNSRMYVSRFDQATWFLLHGIGVTPASMRQKNLRVAIVRQNYQFLEELRGGELVEVRSGFLTVGQKYFRFLHQMYNYETKNLVATCDCVAVEASLETARSVLLEKQMIERARQHLVSAEIPTHSEVG
jgi:acyl-CoA thioester hydrolase